MSNNREVTLGFFFGAGAERNFGLPDGGEFALSLFKQDYSELKKDFLWALQKICATYPKDSSYRKWLDYTNAHKNQIRSFSKQDFQIVLESTAEQKKHSIVRFLNDLDNKALQVYQDLSNDHNPPPAPKGRDDKADDQYRSWHDSLKSLLNIEQQANNESITLNQHFNTETNLHSFLNSKTFIIMLTALRPQDKVDELENKTEDKITDEIYHNIKLSCKVMLYMALIACGDDILKSLNNCVFSSNNEQDQVLSEVSALFTMDYSDAAEQILNFIQQEPLTVQDSNAFDALPPFQKLNIIVNKLAYKLCAEAMDYQKLIDNYFRYIMTPSTDWAKFTKIILFLRAAYEAIVRPKVEDKTLTDNDSYYQDIIKTLNVAKPNFKLVALGSSNYIDFYGRLVKLLVDSNNMTSAESKKYLERFGKLERLNGGVDEFYNPFKNSLVPVAKLDRSEGKEKNNMFLAEGQIVAPFFFTQSGIKPITSIEVSCRYADLYRRYLNAKAIVVVGFNFNSDDSHINTIFRELVENEGKHLFCTSVDPNKIEEQVIAICDKLRIDRPEAVQRVHVIAVDRAQRTIIHELDEQGKAMLWLDYVIEQLQ